jgi:capsular polysaccharide biosynthesis protein
MSTRLPNDEWYESEESTRKGMIQELQRIKRRTRVRPIPVILVAMLITGGITYKMATKKNQYRGEVVLAIREGSLLSEDKRTGLPVGELKEFVSSVLLPDAKLAELIERRNLFRLRKKLGMPWAINELRESLEIEVWRNSFVYYDPENPNREASARVGLTVIDEDPDDAFLLARDLADIVKESVREQRQDVANKVSAQIAHVRDGTYERLAELEAAKSEKMVQIAAAKKDGKKALAQALEMQLLKFDDQIKSGEKTLTEIATSPEALSDRISRAGLDLIVEIVAEKRPIRPESKGLLIAMILVVVGVGSLLGSALVLGAFDSRVHDTDDVERLGLPVLGHVPGFPGDTVGSLEARGVQRARVPSFLRWRSQ